MTDTEDSIIEIARFALSPLGPTVDQLAEMAKYDKAEHCKCGNPMPRTRYMQGETGHRVCRQCYSLV